MLVAIHWAGWLGVLVTALWLLSMTLRGYGDGESQSVHLAPFSAKLPALACLLRSCNWSDAAARFLWTDLLGNIAVFVPLGGAAALATAPQEPDASGGWWPRLKMLAGWLLRATGVGFGLSLGIEVAQLWVPGRVTDIDDLILNVLGTFSGAVLLSGLWLLAGRAGRHVYRT